MSFTCLPIYEPKFCRQSIWENLINLTSSTLNFILWRSVLFSSCNSCKGYRSWWQCDVIGIRRRRGPPAFHRPPNVSTQAGLGQKSEVPQKMSFWPGMSRSQPTVSVRWRVREKLRQAKYVNNVIINSCQRLRSDSSSIWTKQFEIFFSALFFALPSLMGRTVGF